VLTHYIKYIVKNPYIYKTVTHCAITIYYTIYTYGHCLIGTLVFGLERPWLAYRMRWVIPGHQCDTACFVSRDSRSPWQQTTTNAYVCREVHWNSQKMYSSNYLLRRQTSNSSDLQRVNTNSDLQWSQSVVRNRYTSKTRCNMLSARRQSVLIPIKLPNLNANQLEFRCTKGQRSSILRTQIVNWPNSPIKLPIGLQI